ncbi:MAG: hypothetical protein RIT43_522 [Bacteroidota bacterium]|jgi:hypothetical protein
MKKILFFSALICCAIAFGKIIIAPPELNHPRKTKDIFQKEKTKKKATSKNRIIVIDYRLPSYKKRLWVKEGKKVLLNTYVSHGKNSGFIQARSFSNEVGSYKSCYGRFKTSEIYHGQHGLSMRVIGLDPCNSNARERGIVFHAAEYATEKFLRRNGFLGRSEGCFATSKQDNKRIIELTQEYGALDVFVFR